MPTPADHDTVESRLAELRAPHAAAAPPEGFLAHLARKRAARRRLVATRAAVGVLGVTIAAVAIQFATTPRVPPQLLPAPIGLTDDEPDGTATTRPTTGTQPGAVTLASFRPLYTHADHAQESLQTRLAKIFAELSDPPVSNTSPPLRLGDREAFFASSSR